MLLAKRDIQIRKLEIENMELKSKFDKFPSIFPSSPPGVGGENLEKYSGICPILIWVPCFQFLVREFGRPVSPTSFVT